jgi:hypothetical protein
VYLHPSETITKRDGKRVTATFFAPFDRNVEPYIRIATGDYPKLEQEWGRDNALGAYIMSLSHEVVHYFQWVNTGNCSERGVVVKARSMLRKYAMEVDRP